mgnify:FL=1
MQFSIPPKFEPIAILNKSDVSYDFAIKSKTKKLEIRYWVLSIRRSAEEPNNEANTIHRGVISVLRSRISGLSVPG